MPPPPRATGLRSVLRYLPRYRGALILGAATLVVGQLLVAYAPQLLRGALSALDRSVAGFDASTARDRATRFAVAYAAVVLVQGLLGYATRRAIVGASRRFERDLKRDAFDHLVALPVPFFDRVRTGDLLSRLTSDVEAVRFSVGPGVMYLAQTAVKLPAALVAMATMEWRLACLVLLPLAGIAVVVRWLSPAVLQGSRAVQDRLADLSSKAQENFAGARVVRAYALEEREKADFRALNDRLVADTLGLARSRALLSGGLRLSGDLGLLAVVAYGGWLVTGRVTDVPTLVAFLFYLDMLVWPMISFGYVLASFQRASAAMGRLDELFATPPEPSTTLPSATPPARWRGALEVRGLTFAYPGANRPALRDVSVKVPAGTTLAVVGPVGSGKSTLVGLLARLRDVPPGTVFLDGLDVDAVPVHALRAAFAYVPQDGFLFSASVRDNVAYGAAAPPDDATVRAALDAAGLAGDLAAMPDGMATVVGERGITLSGGQRQRATIARALVADAPVLVVDDALSAVDTRTEARILDGLRRAREGRTAVLVAHRLSTVRDADRILVLDDGRVAEAGTHDELLRADGWYARTWRAQRLQTAMEELA
ncbi:MAG: ABC transporter ATP-binding protein [Planctomycetota bacterium]